MIWIFAIITYEWMSISRVNTHPNTICACSIKINWTFVFLFSFSFKRKKLMIIRRNIYKRTRQIEKKKQLSKWKIFSFFFLPFCLGLSACYAWQFFLSVNVLIFLTRIGLLRLSRSISCHPFLLLMYYLSVIRLLIQ